MLKFLGNIIILVTYFLKQKCINKCLPNVFLVLT